MDSQASAWKAVADILERMLQQTRAASTLPVDVQRLAQDYAHLAQAYLTAIVHTGRTSMRAEAAAKALDLRTPKSQLLKFLKRDLPPATFLKVP